MIFFIWVQVSFSPLHSVNRTMKNKATWCVNSSPTKLRWSEEVQSERIRLRNFSLSLIYFWISKLAALKPTQRLNARDIIIIAAPLGYFFAYLQIFQVNLFFTLLGILFSEVSCMHCIQLKSTQPEVWHFSLRFEFELCDRFQPVKKKY